MSNLTADQVTELTTRLNARLAEFGKIATYMPDLSCGVVRIAFDVIEEWMARTDYLGQDGEPAANFTWQLKADPETGRLREVAPWEANGTNGTAPHAIPVPDDEPIDPPPLTDHIRAILARWVQLMGALAEDLSAGDDADGAGQLLAEILTLRATFDLYGVTSALYDASDTTELAAHWPDMEGIPDGEDLFAEHPVAGVPVTDDNEGDPPSAPYRDQAPKINTVVPRQPTPDPRVPDPEVDAERAERAKELDAVVAALRAMAVDGEMPTVAKWEHERVNDLPSWKTISLRHGLLWVELARKAGLHYTRQGSVEAEVKVARAKAEERKNDRLVTYEMLVAEIRRIAMGSAMPTQAQFDQSKPASWPTANALVMRLGTSWADLADVLDLDLQRGRKKSVES